MHAIPLPLETQEESPFFLPDWEDTRTGEASEDLLEGVTAVKERLAWLVAPLEPLLEEVLDELTAATITLEELAHVLDARGYRVKIHTSPGCGLHSLPHTFLTARAPGNGLERGLEVIVDPCFSDTFLVARPTPRYSLLHSLLPRLLVASPHRTFEAISIMAEEMEAAFKQQGMPLPPWRKLDSLAFRYHPAFSAAYSAACLAARPAAYAGANADAGAVVAEGSMAAPQGAGPTAQGQAAAGLPAQVQAAGSNAGPAAEILALARRSLGGQHAPPNSSHRTHPSGLGAATYPLPAGRSAQQARQRTTCLLGGGALSHSQLVGPSSAPPALAAE